MNSVRMIAAALPLALASITAASTASPLRAAESTPPAVEAFGGTALLLTPLRADVGEELRIRLPLNAHRQVDLQLQRIDVLDPDASMEVATVLEDGTIAATPMEFPRVDCFQGHVDGEPDSHVFLAVGPTTANGWIERNDELHVISTHPDEGWTAIYDLKTIDPVDMNWKDFNCAVREIASHKPDASSRPRNRGDLNCLAMLMAIETDWEFASLFGGNLDAASEYIQTLVAAVSSIYDRDIGIKVTISYTRLWADSSDPWTSGDAGAQLSQFQSNWESTMDQISRHMAHFFSGRNLGGGVAYLGTLCTNYGYAVSGNMNGYFPTPLENNNGANWDPMVVAHETGHTCGSGHTHDSYNPPIDGCGNGDCSGANQGTVMSYCHLCGGGMSNMRMEFHPQVQNVIINYLETGISCELAGDGSAPFASSDLVNVLGPDPVDIPVLDNDYTNDCSVPIVSSWETVSLDGGTIELVGDDAVQGILRYTPPSGGIIGGGDFFRYDIEDANQQSASASVLILEIAARAPDTPSATEPGPTAAYYELNDPQVLPDFAALEPYLVETITDVNYPSTNGNFAGSGRSENFGVVFDGFIEVPTSDQYTIYTDSDDGSKLYVGDELLIDNDGLHGMREIAGTIALQAGRHAIRVEFFERGGGAGCIVRIEGGGLDKQAVPASMWSHEIEVVGDINEDGQVDVTDLLQVILDWGSCPPFNCPSDLDGNGLVNVEDLLIVLSGW